MPQALFLSDLHLSESEPGLTARFLNFLQDRAGQANALYILGDLFNVWLGDDDDSAFAHQIKAALRQASGLTTVFIQHGNRDFLLGRRFAAETGCQLLADEAIISIGGKPVLLMHGDQLCTDDLAYQQARSYLRNARTISDFLAKSLQERSLIAAQLRQKSGEAMKQKAADIMDVSQQAVVEALTRHGATLLIHGHTHRPAMHEFLLDGQPARRLVCGDWRPEGALIVSMDVTTGQARLIEV